MRMNAANDAADIGVDLLAGQTRKETFMIDTAHEHRSSANMSSVRNEYERRLTQARNHFAERKSLSMILDARLEADLLHIFLVYFSALGVGMTEPVESWIRRAGERCREMGLSETGAALIRHAGQEAG